MIKNLLHHVNFQKNKKIILGVIFLIFMSVVAFSFLSGPVKNRAHKSMRLTIPAMGNLPALHLAMDNNKLLRGKVKELLSYDKTYLFAHYPQVNDQITEIMFLWIGLSAKQIEQKNRQELAEYFIRRLYNLPKDEPIKNNPLLEKYPWASLFQKIKSKLLMQGQGYKIYKGIAYYDSAQDKMVIEGALSPSFAESLSQFIKERPQAEQKRYINNYLMFIDKTLGLKNLSGQEKEFLKKTEFL